MQGHRSKYPCAWCYATAPFTEKAAVRKIGELKDLASKFNDPDGNNGLIKNAMNFYNVVNQPLIDGSDDTCVLDVIPLGELHILLGKCVK